MQLQVDPRCLLGKGRKDESRLRGNDNAGEGRERRALSDAGCCGRVLDSSSTTSAR